MYLSKEQIERRILETFDKIVCYNGKRLDEVLPVEERLLICTSIMQNLPPTMPDIITKYHKDRKLKENISLKDIYFHLLEEVMELGQELGLGNATIYEGLLNRFVKIYKRKSKSTTKEGLLNELSDVSIIIGSISDYVNMNHLLFDGILEVVRSNDSKICNLEQVKETIKEKGLSESSIRTHDLGNNKFIMIDEDTGKTVKPISYRPPNFKHLFK